MRTISLLKASQFEPEFYNSYSRFKHGSKSQARIFGELVGAVCDFEPNTTLVFYSAPYNNIPPASNAFKDYLLSYCSAQFMDKCITIRQGKIQRAYSYDGDYGKMNKAQRESVIAADIFSMDKSMVTDTDTLVFIDDIKITGSHEKMIVELIEREGIKNKCMAIYIAEYTGESPEIEHSLNQNAVSNLKDVNNIIRNEEFIFNTRVVKFILRSDIEHFVSFITYQSNTFRDTLFSLSILNNYHTNMLYKTNFNILKDLL